MHLSAARAAPGRRARGFTLIEALVTMTILGLLMATAIPSFTNWIRNSRIRTVAQALQDGIRLAQSEAIRRNRQTVFSLTNDTPTPGGNPTAAANGVNWVIYTVPLLGFESRQFVQAGSLSDAAGGVVITGPAAICLNTAGRQVANAATGVTSATCTVNSTGALVSYNVAMASGDRPLRVTVSLGGQVRMCDPARTLSATAADGCP